MKKNLILIDRTDLSRARICNNWWLIRILRNASWETKNNTLLLYETSHTSTAAINEMIIIKWNSSPDIKMAVEHIIFIHTLVDIYLEEEKHSGLQEINVTTQWRGKKHHLDQKCIKWNYCLHRLPKVSLKIENWNKQSSVTMIQYRRKKSVTLSNIKHFEVN